MPTVFCIVVSQPTMTTWPKCDRFIVVVEMQLSGTAIYLLKSIMLMLSSSNHVTQVANNKQHMIISANITKFDNICMKLAHQTLLKP